MVNDLPITQVHWAPSWRLVPSRFPTVGLFDRVTSPEELDAVYAIESMTNDRLRDEVGELHLVPQNERQTGPGTTPIMACFTHLNREGSRFSDGTYGVYYAAKDIETALAETIYHRELFLQRTNESPIDIDMRSYASDIDSEFHDVREKKYASSPVYDPNTYTASKQLARELRDVQSNGIVYNSVRCANGECVAIFRPNIPMPVTQGSHYCFQWDGTCISDIYRKTSL